MEPNRVEFQKQCIFQSFCKRVLHNEACNAHEEIRRRRAKEVSFSDLALHLTSRTLPLFPILSLWQRQRATRTL